MQSAESCSYQEDHYRVDVVNTEGIRVILQPAHYFDYPRTSDNNSLHRYYLDSGLREGANYTVVVIAASLAGSMKSSQGVAIGKDLKSSKQHFIVMSTFS